MKNCSIFYADFFSRKGKRNGAWMTSYKSQFVKTESTKDHTSQMYVILQNLQKQNLPY
jgi:Zn-dependent oligopeptidase